MSIPYTCPHCEFQGKASDSLAGQNGRCPKCKQPIQIGEIDWAEREAQEHQEAMQAMTEVRLAPESHSQQIANNLDEVQEILNENAQRRDDLLELIAQRLWWISLWGCLLFLLLLLGCPVIYVEIGS